MSVTPELLFRRLGEDEIDLALGLAASVVPLDEPLCEAWGIGPDGTPLPGAEVWGLFMRGTLAGAAWLSAVHFGTVEIMSLALPRGRWGMGLVVWMAGEAAREAASGGAEELLVRLVNGGSKLGELLEDSGFSGPNIESEDYPRGEWRRRLS